MDEYYNDKRCRSWLAQFLAKYDPDEEARHEHAIYEELAENDVAAVCARISARPGSRTDPWPWRKCKTADQWHEFYLDNEDFIDEKAAEFKREWAKQAAAPKPGPSKPRAASKPPSSPRKSKTSASRQRVLFDQDDQYNLMQYLAIECPGLKGRMSINTYNKLVNDLEGRWPWASRHPPEGWREHYKKRTNIFDPWIKKHQEKLGIDPTDSPRSDLWDEVEQRDSTKGGRKQAPKPPSKPSSSQAKSAQRPPKPSSSQNRPPRAVPKKKSAPKRPRESESETEAEEPASPIRAQANGKARVVVREEEEEESQQDERGAGLPVVREAEEEAGLEAQEVVELEPQVANRPVSPPLQGGHPVVQEDEDVEMVDVDDEVDELESTPARQAHDEVKEETGEVYVPSTQLVREFNELQERQAEHQGDNASPQQSETQDAQEAEDLLSGPDPQAADDVDDSELVEQEVDELVSDEEQPADPKPPAAHPPPRKAPQASPRVVVQEPTPPTSDSTDPPVNASVETSADASQPGPSTMYARHTTTVLRKRTREDFFEDLESEAQTSTPPRPTKRRALHVLEEGKFGTTSLREVHKPGTAFRKGRRRSGVDEVLPAAIAEEADEDVRPEELEWPPVWNKRKGKEVAPAVASPAKAGPSSRVRTPEPPAAEEEDAEDPGSPNPFAASDVGSSPIKAPARGAARHASVEPTEIDSDDGEFPASPLKRPSTRAMPPPPPPPQAGPSRTPAQTPFRPQLIPKGKEPGPTPSSSKGKERALPVPTPASVRRRTLPDAPTRRSPSHSSSRSSLQGRKARASLPAPRRASPLAEVGGMRLGADEFQALLEKGMEATLRELSARTGFAPDVVRDACRRMHSFALAERWLTRMSRVVAEHADDVEREVRREASGELFGDDGEEEGEERDDADEEEDAPAGGQGGSGGEGGEYYPPEGTQAWALEKSRVEEEEAEAHESRHSAAHSESPQPQPNRWKRVLRPRGEKRR